MGSILQKAVQSIVEDQLEKEDKMANNQLKIQIGQGVGSQKVAQQQIQQMQNATSGQTATTVGAVNQDPFTDGTIPSQPQTYGQQAQTAQQQNIANSAQALKQNQTQQQLNMSMANYDAFIDADDEVFAGKDGFTNDSLTPTIIDTSGNGKDGQNKCPKCGSTDISQNKKTGKLRCNFCRHEFAPQTMEELHGEVYHLHGEFMGSGTQDIQESANDVLTLKCQSCGAEVIISTAESTQARCHWCRNYLSINNQLPNGSIPDAILPFAMDREEARRHIEEFVGKRKFYAHPKFKKEFTTENVMGVYFPYYIADVNGHASMSGVGEHLIRKYTVGSGDDKETYYDADEYEVARDFDIAIQNLTVEASADKLNLFDNSKTTNIINSIMPFDTENCVHYDANYLRGFTSERRDTNVDNVRQLVRTQASDIARYRATETLEFYDRGVHWNSEQFQIKGQRWSTAYLPVWLYSYYQDKGNGQGQLHYVAVNARTKETMGSVPIHYPKLISISAIIEIIALIVMVPLLILFAGSGDDDGSAWPLVLAAAGFVYYFFIYGKYRNKGARHFHEKETKNEVYNMKQRDVYIRRKTRMKNAQIENCNCYAVNGTLVQLGGIEKFADSLIKR